MTAITIARQAGLEHRIEPAMVRIFDLLKARPNVPIPYEEVSSLIQDASFDHIVEILEALEGPVYNGGDSQPAYIRCCDRNRKAVYID
ncbi:MAG: hypothetical protein C4534_08385 [Gaiellales bacterium]|nr:MAG: hypothetical protein C4534_08385 [Gaiellales bacterium]